jgi:hypothetical protein
MGEPYEKRRRAYEKSRKTRNRREKGESEILVNGSDLARGKYKA